MSSIASGISAWVEINLPQYAEGEQTLHHLEGENSLNGETHQAKTNSTTQRLDAEETDHDQDKSKANLVRSKVTVDDSSPTTQEIGDGVAMPVEESRRSDGNLEVANNIAREMSDEIVDSLLNRVLLEELNGNFKLNLFTPGLYHCKKFLKYFKSSQIPRLLSICHLSLNQLVLLNF